MKRLGNESNLSDVYPGWKTIQEWLASGKKVHLLSMTPENFQEPANGRALRIASAFLPHLQEQMLELTVGFDFMNTVEPHAILLNEKDKKATLLFPPDYVGSSLEKLWPDTILAKEIAIEEVSDFFVPGRPVPINDFQPPTGVQHAHYRMGKSAISREIFSLSLSKRSKALRSLTDTFLPWTTISMLSVTS